MEKMQMPSVAGNEKKSEKTLLENLSKSLKRLKMLGIVVGTMFMAGELHAQSTMQEGTISADSMIYKMNPEQAGKITKLTHEVDSMMHVLKQELQKNGSVSNGQESINDRLVSSVNIVEGKNVEVGAPGSFVVDYKGDTVTMGDNWMFVADTINAKSGDVVLQKETYYFDKGKHGTTLEHYTNKTNQKYGGEQTSFTYGGLLREDNGIMVEHFIEGSPENKHERVLNFDQGSAQNGFTQLEETLTKLESKLAGAIQENK